MKRVLWISLFVPYDKVRHAGGKIHNYYLKSLKAADLFDIKLLTFAEPKDMPEVDLETYNISNDIICYDTDWKRRIFRNIINMESTYNPYNRYGRALQNYDILKIRQYLKAYHKEGYKPDVIILQWTQIVFLLPYVKKLYPNAKIIAIEEDVTYLSYQRKMHYYPKVFLRYISKVSYKRVKKLEIAALRRADLIILNNHKDEKLILKEDINKDKIFVWTPYFQNFLQVERKNTNHNIIFYGGMGRQENYLSAIWFAQKVMPLLQDTDVQFLIIGANPDKCLYEYEAENIKVIGFVEHVEEYLSESLCLVAPLVFGAGVKIKVLEAMSAGIPVLTNDVGIEGINAVDGREYFYCSEPEEYEHIIRKMLQGQIDIEGISRNAKEFMQNNYSLDKSVEQFIAQIREF